MYDAMKCSACQRHLLKSENPALPAHDAAGHLAICSSCRDYHRRLLSIEGNVASIPVPRTRAKEVLLRKILEPAAPPPGPAILPLTRPSRWRKMALRAAGLAAAVALAVSGVYLGNWLSRSLQPAGPSPLARGTEKTPRPSAREAGAPKSTQDEKKTPIEKGPADPAPTVPPLMTRLMACDLKLAEADNPRQRVEALAALADELQGETRILASTAGTKDLKTLARLYERVIRDGVVVRARDLPAELRRPVLKTIADRLDRTDRDLKELALEERPESAEPLRQIAAAAQEGGIRLRVLMGKETP
jgi:hypothetical protein